MAGTLYIIATPIGNLEDISPRARRVLEEADLIAAEDTQHSGALLHKLGISGRMVSNYKFNERARLDFFLEKLREGQDVALISDAGTPGICDPGFLLAREAAREGIAVTGISGPCAIATALSVSGFDASCYGFYGFVPRQDGDRKRFFENILAVAVCYESPRRIKKTMQALCEILPEAEICLCNDLTKLHERIYRGNPGQVLDELLANPNAEKGEYALVLRHEKAEKVEQAVSLEALLVDAMLREDCSLKEAVRQLADTLPYPKREIYDASLRLKAWLASREE